MVRDEDDLHCWQVLRALRSDPPGFAVKGPRAKIFSAGLEQAEQLWAASDAVGSVASPLLMFYGLTQAGRALCAAGFQQNAGWRSKHGHGLEFKLVRPPDGALINLRNVTVAECGSGLVQTIAEVLSTPILAAATSILELIASLDGDFYFFDPALLGTPRPLVVREEGLASMQWGDPAVAALSIGPVPVAWMDRFHLVAATEQSPGYRQIQRPTPAEVAEWLRRYPTLNTLGAPSEVRDIVTLPGDHPFVRVQWNSHGEPAVKQHEWTLRFLDVVKQPDRYRPYVHGLALPALGGNARPQHPLISWWLVLYSLSMLARYYPNEWTQALDVDRSNLAVALDHLIATARRQVPRLIVEAVLDFER